MTHSLSPHCIITEPSLKTMSGKGREGKGIRKGREACRDFSIHLTPRNARAATASGAKPQPGHDRFGWMVQGFNGGQR